MMDAHSGRVSLEDYVERSNRVETWNHILSSAKKRWCTQLDTQRPGDKDVPVRF